MNKSNRHFVTVLGTSNYSECMYEIENGNFSYTTPFVQMAVLNYVMPEYQEGDRITVFVTEEARKNNWEDRLEKPEKAEYQKNKKLVNAKRFRRRIRLGKKVYWIHLQIAEPNRVSMKKKLPKEKTRRGLEFLLRQEFPNVEIDAVEIPKGKNKQELDGIFESIYQSLSYGENVYFDFTHGLRNLPMHALAVVNYAKVLKDIKVGGLYYGAFELGEFDEDGIKHVQILDMLSCSTIQDWTSAAETFVKAGSGNQIYELYQRQEEQIDAGKECADILGSLYDLTNCLETSRGAVELGGNERDRTKKSIACAYKSFQDNYNQLNSKELPTSEYPLRRLFEYIYEDIKPFEKKLYAEREGRTIELRYTAMGIEAVRWAVKKNLIQQGYTALSETVESYVCELYGINAGEERKRRIVRDALKGEHLRKANFTNPGVNPSEAMRKAWADRWETNNSGAENKMIIDKMKQMLMELPGTVFYLSHNVADDRNSVNHFGIRREHISYPELRRKLQHYCSRMEELLEKEHGAYTRAILAKAEKHGE